MGHQKSQRHAACLRRGLLASSAITRVASVAAIAGALALQSTPASAACTPLTVNADNTLCSGALDGTSSDAIGGNDTINFTTNVGVSAGATVSGGMDDDSIVLNTTSDLGVNAGGAGQVLGAAGADTITLDRSNVGVSGAGTVSGGLGADSIAVSDLSVIGFNSPGTGQVLGDGGADTITLDNSRVGNAGAGTVSGGGENDSIALSNGSRLGNSNGSSGQVLGDDGADTITLNRTYVGEAGDGTVSGGLGADSIVVSNYSSVGRLGTGTGQVLGDAGADTITFSGSYVGNVGAGTVSGGGDDDSIALSMSRIGNNANATGQVLGDTGADTITLNRIYLGFAGAGTVSGGGAGDSIALSNITVIGRFDNSTGQVLGDSGADTITLNNSQVGSAGDGTVSGGSENDSIALSNGSRIGNLSTGTGQVLGDAGADTITLNQSRVGDEGAGTVSGGADNDFIALSGSRIGNTSTGTGQVLGDDGSDTITLNQSYVGQGGAGTVSGGANNDLIALSNFSRIGDTSTGTGQVLGDDGADTITLDSSVVGYFGAGTVSGGGDTDSIALNSSRIGRFINGTGQVLGDAGADTITLNNSTVGDFGDGTVSGGGDADVIALSNDSSIGSNSAGSGQVLGDEGGDTITLDQSYVGNLGDGTVSGGGDADSIALSNFSHIGRNSTGSGQVLGDAGADTITLDRSDVGYAGDGTVSGGDENDSIALSNNRVGGTATGSGQVLGDAGADTITLNRSYVGSFGDGTVSGGGGADSIALSSVSRLGYSNTATGQVLGDAGADTITLDQSIVGNFGAGTVSGGGENDFIALSNRSRIGFSNTGTGQVLGDEGADTITLDDSDVGFAGEGTVSGGGDADSIALSNDSYIGGRFGGGGTGQVLGDAGADTITLDNSSVGGAGAGMVSGGSENDSIALSGSSLARNNGSSGQVLGDEGADTITLSSSNVGFRGEGTVSGGLGADSIALSYFSRIGGQADGIGQVLGDAGADTITLDDSYVGNLGAGTVSGGADADSIALSNGSRLGSESAGSGQVLGDEGADTITLDGSFVGVFGDGTVSGGSENDSITVIDSSLGRYAGSTGVVLGDAGNDTIFVDPSYVGYAGDGTVSGGAGNDSIAFEDSFIGFTATGQGQVLGDAGNDTITLDNTAVGVAGSATVDGGANNDSIVLSNGASLGAQGQVLGNAGNDTVGIDESVTRAAGSVIDGGTETDLLAFTANEDAMLAPDQFLNFEQLQKRGAAALTLTGDQTWTDSTSVADGTLIVAGQLTSATTTVNPGARLETMGGSFVGNLVNRGIFSPGGDAVIETTSVTGNLVHGPEGVFIVNANPNSADRVDVSGTATIEGGEVQVIAENGTYAPSTEYTIIATEGGRDGEFDGVTDNLAFLDPSLEYDPNNVFLVLERNEEPLPPGVICRVDDTLCRALLNLTPEGANEATKALSGEVHSTLGSVLIDQSRYVRDAILGRLTQATYGEDAAPLAGAASYDSAALKLGSGSSYGDPAYDSGLTFWTHGFGAWGDFDGSATASSADTEIAGFISGIDAQVSGTWRAGLATGYTWSDIDVDALYSAAEVESYYLAAYAGGMAGPFALRTGGAYAWQDIDTSRAVVFPGFFEREQASYDAETSQIFGEVAYPMTMGGVSVEPFAGLAYVNFDADAFRERGGLAALNGTSTNADTGYTTLGLRLAQTMQWANMDLTPRISVAWQHAFDDLTVPTALAFQSSGVGAGFTTTGVPIAEDSFLLDTGFDLHVGENTTLGISYSGQFAGDVQDNAVKGRFNWKF